MRPQSTQKEYDYKVMGAFHVMQDCYRECGNHCCLDVTCAMILVGGIADIFGKTLLFLAIGL
jgi:hypothetical protein